MDLSIGALNAQTKALQGFLGKIDDGVGGRQVKQLALRAHQRKNGAGNEQTENAAGNAEDDAHDK